MELLKLIGIVIVVIGFALKLDSILVIMIAAVATALVSGMDQLTFFQTLGDGFVSNRSMLILCLRAGGEHGGGHPLHACGDYGAGPHIGSRSRGEAPRG